MTVTLQKLNCPNCSAPLDWDGTYGKPIICPYCGAQFMPGPTAVDDLWLFTGPVARARFEFNGKLDKLEHDIRYEVLRGGTWSALDRGCKSELDRLERDGVIRKLASFWALSPFPPVYRARLDGEFTPGGRRFSFRKGQELVWACPMTRDCFELDYPILISDLESDRTDTTPDSPNPDPNAPWAFTDPDARDEYARRGQLKRLERDIRYEVMRGGPWQPEELEYKSEIRQLLREGVIADKGTYWFRSPHPTVFRAQRDGALSVAGKTYRFRAGDDLVFQCRMERDESDDDPGPALITQLQRTDEAVLCGGMSGAMRGMGKRT